MSRIQAVDLVIEFPIYGIASRSFKSSAIRVATGGVLGKDSADRVLVRAVDQVSFDLKAGDRLGLLGHNGSGKTTLLRALAGVYEPSSGFLRVKGRVASMLSISLGMELEATGLENIYLRGIVMGLSKKNVRDLVDEVCEFADLGDYIHMPLRTYSSGMSMRLAFAMSTSIKSDIILMDEWLSVGDGEFVQKAENRLQEMTRNAEILVIASHNPALLSANCNKIITLEHGRIVSIT
ncbi:MAG: ABC transporter ATP-binding protein [Dolichospermum sp.]|nr:ABC transporter ATP-binding protein [Dolichospermum sp.]